MWLKCTEDQTNSIESQYKMNGYNTPSIAYLAIQLEDKHAIPDLCIKRIILNEPKTDLLWIPDEISI